MHVHGCFEGDGGRRVTHLHHGAGYYSSDNSEKEAVNMASPSRFALACVAGCPSCSPPFTQADCVGIDRIPAVC